ncbi:MAG: hypothetical protein ACJ72W_27005, partial [Actinoallomurus sp.]
MLQEFCFEPADVLNRHVVEFAVGGGPQGDDLPLDRERGVLGLLEQLDQAGSWLDLMWVVWVIV